MEKAVYHICQAYTVEDIEADTQKLIDEGWQPASPVIIYKDAVDGINIFIHEMVKFPPPSTIIPHHKDEKKLTPEEFEAKVSKMDSRVKELLDINQIKLFCTPDGKLATAVGEKVVEGIAPNDILMALKNSKHCPMDLDEQMVLNAIEDIL